MHEVSEPSSRPQARPEGDATAIQEALLDEMREVRHRMGIVVYVVETRLGRLDRALLEWLLPLMKANQGPNRMEDAIRAVEGLLSRSDEDLAIAARRGMRQPGRGLTMPPVGLPLFESMRDRLPSLARGFRQRILDLVEHVRMFNKGCSDADAFTQLTFQPGITSENHAKAIRNAEDLYGQLAFRARVIAERVGELEAEEHANGAA